MPSFILSYRATDTGPARDAALAAFEGSIRRTFDASWRHSDGLWIVLAETTADEIRDRLIASLRTGSIVVARIKNDAAWSGLEPAATDWLVEHL
jgi:hypothetical protein